MSELSPIVQLHPNVKAAMINPSRALEVRGWLKTNSLVARAWRGEDGETMMHWAFLADWVLASELKDNGLAFDATDRYGRTPMDWLNDRLWYAIVEPNTNSQLSAGAKERLRRQSEQQIQYLWAQGARPSMNTNLLHPGVVWMRAGAWDLLPLLKDDEAFTWFNWAPYGGHALHSLVLAPNMPQRRQFLKKWAEDFDIDIPDNQGRSALWYAVDAWLASEQWQRDLLAVIKELVGEGASPLLKNDEGVSALSLVHASAPKNAGALLDVLLSAKPVEEEQTLDEDDVVVLATARALRASYANPLSNLPEHSQ